MQRAALILGVCAALCAGCDGLAHPIIATAPGGAQTGTPTSTPLQVLPASVQLAIGTTVQLRTNATADQQGQLEWTSLAPQIAAVNAAGVVTGLAPGTATIRVRFAFDTTRVAFSVVTVTGTAPGSTGGTTG